MTNLQLVELATLLSDVRRRMDVLLGLRATETEDWDDEKEAQFVALEQEVRLALYSGLPGAADRGMDHLEQSFVPQNMQFMADCLPMIGRLLKGYSRQQTVTFLDVGTGTGAGANMLAMMHRSLSNWCSVQVDALDRISARYAYATFSCPDIREIIISDITNLPPERKWDIVFCSHCLEHVPEPGPFIRQLEELARDWVLIYVPYDEKDMEKTGHLHRITESFFAAYDPVETEIISSLGWRHDKGNDGKCVLVRLRGRAGR